MKHFINSTKGVSCRMDRSYEYLEARPSPQLDIYYGRLSELDEYVSLLQNVLGDDENRRVQQLRNRNDKHVYILSHSLLRFLLAGKLDRDPYNIVFMHDKNGRPYMPGGELFFNISHTKYAFSIAIARTYVPGIDIERIDRNIDHDQIASNYFSYSEVDYIAGDTRRRNAFYMLWTRKESLLKSIGSGIVTDLTRVEVSGDKNILPSVLFPHDKFSPVFEKYFIYSLELDDHYLSVTIPEKRNLEVVRFSCSMINDVVGAVKKEFVN
ncbi:MAG: 4'-phosphopantetheinyl transferase superfamily protein [Bacteroidales bacterium]|nr:4'-phosphopantetheinyl transferase superfamily protein [Bacteroidales bacterium]